MKRINIPQKCIHKIFEEQVDKTPNSIAVVFQEEKLTYQQLNQKANQLAYYLQSQGVKPEVLVGIFVEPSLEMVIAILGVLKAGGAYVPIDTDYPLERIYLIVEDTQVSFLLTQEKSLQKIPQKISTLVFLDRDWSTISQQPKYNFDTNVTLDNLSLIIYTSGSTGKPKGVMLTHGNLSHYISALGTAFNLRPDDVYLYRCSIAVIACARQLLMPLCQGITVVFSTKEEQKDPVALFDLAKQKNVTILDHVPSFWRSFFTLLSQLQPEAKKDLLNNKIRLLGSGGEQVTLDIAKNWQREFNNEIDFINIYGQSEGTGVVTIHYIPRSVDSISKSVPIGRPIPNMQIYLLDEQLKPVTTGVVAELFVAGNGLARGYINRPQLTQEKFIPNPFPNSPHKRLYKTGDLGRYLPDGNIEYIGRIDNQVKIRGYRIEPGEIESVLTQHPHIEESIVLATQKTPDNQNLVAYIVPTQEQVPSLEELRSLLKQKLPQYMIPSAFVPIEAMPLNSNGKIDRLALAKLNIGRQTSAQNYVAPRNSTEKKLVEIWTKILWLEQEIGIHDNFFDLGGHSLLSVRLIAEIEKEFNQKIPLAALFKLGTIAELAHIIDQETDENNLTLETFKHPDLSQEIYDKLLAYTAGWQGKRVRPNSLIIGMNTTGTKQPLFWCLQGYRELSQLSKYLGEDQPTYGMRSGHLFMEYTPENIQALAAHYVSEILTIQSDSPYLLGGNCQSAWIIFEVAKQLISKGKTITFLCLMEKLVTQPYFGRLTLLFGRESHKNPYQKFRTPELGYRKFYSGEFSVNIISGGHGQFFSEPNIQVLAQILTTEIEKAKLESVSPQQEVKQYQLLPSQAYQGKITAQSPSLIAREGETRVISVVVKNLSSVTWKSTEYSGIKLGNHWLDESEEVFQWADGRVDLPKDVLPGEEIELNLSVTFPTKVGNYFLELDLVEEGITWFKDQGSITTKLSVEVIPSEQVLTQDNSDFYCQQGNSYFEKGDMELAIINYQKATELNPNQPVEVYKRLGDAYSQQENFSEAVVAYNKALELDSNNAQVHFMLGKAQVKQDKLTQAAASYKKAIDLQPDSTWFYENLGQVLNQLGQFEASIEVYNNAIKLDLNNANLYVQLGLAQMKSGDFSGAITSYDQALQLHPENPGIYGQLGNAYSRQGNFTEAIASYLKAIELAPNNPGFYVALGNTQLKCQQIKQAIASYRKAIELNPKQPFGVYKNLGDCLSKQGDIEAAIAAYTQALKLQPNHPAVSRNLAKLKQKQN